MNIKKLIGDYLKQAKILQIATVEGNQPWVCTVYFAFDEKYNLYWLSTPSRRHSQEINNNSKIAGAIVLPHTPGEAVRGLQLQGVAKELSGTEAENGLQCYAKRFGMKQDRVTAILNGTDGHSCYKISPNLFVLFDEVNFPDNPRQEYTL